MNAAWDLREEKYEEVVKYPGISLESW